MRTWRIANERLTAQPKDVDVIHLWLGKADANCFRSCLAADVSTRAQHWQGLGEGGSRVARSFSQGSRPALLLSRYLQLLPTLLFTFLDYSIQHG